MLLQVDLRRRAGAFQHDDIVLPRKDFIAFGHHREEFFDAPLVIVRRTELTPDLSSHDHLRPHFTARLQQDGIHVHRRRDSGGFRL